jgi:hypothetical protein
MMMMKVDGQYQIGVQCHRHFLHQMTVEHALDVRPLHHSIFYIKPSLMPP